LYYVFVKISCWYTLRTGEQGEIVVMYILFYEQDDVGGYNDYWLGVHRLFFCLLFT
jgi:hypothetical protein